MTKYQQLSLAVINLAFVVITLYHAVVNDEWSFTQNAWWFVVVVTIYNQIFNYVCGPSENRWALGKVIGAVIPLSIVWWLGPSYGYPRVFTVAILGMLLVAIGILYVAHKFTPPMWAQRLYYRRWKQSLINLALPGKPTASLGFIIWIHTDLDKHFEAGGMPAARQAVLDWFHNAIENTSADRAGDAR